MASQGLMPGPLIEWGLASRPMLGQVESGDRHLVKPFPNGVLVAVADGLGHGREAAEAAMLAVSILEAHASEPVVPLVALCHQHLKGTRGVALTLACINAQDSSMQWLAVGNVEGLLLRADAKGRDYVVLRGGVVGEHMPSLHATITTIGPGDTLILASDGIGHGFSEEVRLTDHPKQIADRILATYGKSTDDALALVLRYLGRVA